MANALRFMLNDTEHKTHILGMTPASTLFYKQCEARYEIEDWQLSSKPLNHQECICLSGTENLNNGGVGNRH